MEEHDLEGTENNGDLVEGVKKFMQGGCGCMFGRKGGPCSEQFSEEAVLFNLNNCLELTSGVTGSHPFGKYSGIYLR